MEQDGQVDQKEEPRFIRAMDTLPQTAFTRRCSVEKPCPPRDLKVGDRAWAKVTWKNECTDRWMDG